ncbi:MAG: hypothetical protein NVS2B12_05560 [Ktedonobacteraceae bacterium]
MQNNFYRYQQRRLGILLGWGLGSVLVGSVMQWITQDFWKQFGLQALAWGAIDAALALFGIRSARKKERQYEQQELSRPDEEKEARTIRRILLINAGLDGLYILSGSWVIWRFQTRSDRQGMGAGILLQGAWLLVFDALLARDVRKRWLS